MRRETCDSQIQSFCDVVPARRHFWPTFMWVSATVQQRVTGRVLEPWEITALACLLPVSLRSCWLLILLSH